MTRYHKNRFPTGCVVGNHMVQFPADFRQLCGKSDAFTLTTPVFTFSVIDKKARCHQEITLQRKVSPFVFCVISCRLLLKHGNMHYVGVRVPPAGACKLASWAVDCSLVDAATNPPLLLHFYSMKGSVKLLHTKTSGSGRHNDNIIKWCFIFHKFICRDRIQDTLLSHSWEI